MANHSGSSQSSFAPSGGGLLLPALSSTRRSSNNHAPIHHHHQQMQQQQHVHGPTTYQASSSVAQPPPLRASSAMPHVSTRPQVRRRSNSISANSTPFINNNNNNNTTTTLSSPANSTADGRSASVAPTSTPAMSSPTSPTNGASALFSRLPVGAPDMATATISPRIRRLVGSTSSSRGAASVSSNSSSGGDDFHRNRRSSTGRTRRLSLDLSSMVPDHIRRPREHAGISGTSYHNSSSSSNSTEVASKTAAPRSHTSSHSVSTSSPASDPRSVRASISGLPGASSSSTIYPPVPATTSTAVPPATATQTIPVERESKVDSMKVKGKEPVLQANPQALPPGNGSNTAIGAASSTVPESVAELLTELEKELTCSICQSFYLNPVTLDCLHSYCGSCAKEWFEPPPPTSLSSASPTERGCPTCRQPVKSIKASAHLNSLTTIYLRHNPHLQRSQEEIAELAKIYSPGAEILLERDRTGHQRRDRSDTGRRAGDGWWDGLIEEREREDEEALQAAVRASMRDLYENSQSNRRRSGHSNLMSGRLGLSSSSQFSASRALPQASTTTVHGSISLGLGDRMEVEVVSTVGSNPPVASSSGFSASRATPREPQISCDSCGKGSIHSSVHFHCKLCYDDDFDLCLSCVRRGDRCQAAPSQVHELEPRKYNPVTNELEKGFFCDNEFCSENINKMFWHCSICNDGKWDYCTACVNRGDCCSHDLEAMSCEPLVLAQSGVASSSAHAGSSRPWEHDPLRTMADLNLDLVVTRSVMALDSGSAIVDDLTTPFGAARPLKLNTRCDLCHEHISSREEYLHCPTCKGGDWDCHRACLQTISPSASSSQIRCPQSHSLQVIIQLPSPDYHNPTTYLRRVVSPAERPLEQRSYTYKSSHGTTVTLEPPRGENGKFQRARAIWAYWPETSRGDAGDELGFPKNAMIEDILMVNREWYWGSYSGRQGLFPAVYVTLTTDDNDTRRP